ncbi:MAG: cytochrome c3 family protein [Desulforhopalus sp.]
MKRRYLLYAAMVILILSTIECRADMPFMVQWPPDNSFVESEQISIVLKVEKQGLDSIRVGNGRTGTFEIPVRQDGERACFGITLDKGMNEIELHGLIEGRVVEQKNIRIFSRSDLFPKFRKAPAGFKRYIFHLVDNEKSCVGCHDMEPTLSSLRPAAPEQSTCFGCHAAKSVNTFVHNPAAQWTCFTCHEVREGQRKYTTPKPDTKACYPCHNSELKQWKSRRIMHGPTAVGHCTLCHNPHGSGWPALLRMQTTDLCINCHEDKASGAHVIAGFYGKGHPVRGVRDPFNPDREFTCAGCHNPHAGDTQNLLNHDTGNMTAYCTLCHKM